MITRTMIAAATCAALLAAPAVAQFTGPSVQGQASTVADAQNTRIGRYVTLEGNIVAHLRGNYYTFRDDSGEMRVEIPADTFGGRQIGPDIRVSIMGEIDTGRGGRYVWVKSLQPL